MNIPRVLKLLEPLHQPTMLEQLKHYTRFQLLVATLLSARSKDSTTIPIVKELFRRYPGPRDFIELNSHKLEKLIYGVGFYRVKAKHVKELSKILLQKFEGTVPHTLEELTSLPGVGRKTANCLLAYSGIPAIAVDTHVHRISNRLGWVHTKTPEETELALQRIVPKESWSDVNRLLVDHGQRVCLPLRPKCEECAVRQYCDFGRGIGSKSSDFR